MKDQRIPIPKAIQDKIREEYSHSCAICGHKETKPELHHIDEDRTNNNVLNLIPLCSNCHTKQHNIVKAFDKEVLKFYRQNKHPSILLPQFKPLHIRLRFFSNLENLTPDEIERNSKELIEFVAAHEMGKFYSQQISSLIEKDITPKFLSFDTTKSEFNRIYEQEKRKYLDKILRNKEKVIELIIELLEYQRWSN